MSLESKNAPEKVSVRQPQTNVGILIPTFNNGATLARVVGIALLQKLPVIVVNDGSTDETANLLANLPKLPTLHVETHTANRGKGAALTTGIQAAIALGWDAAIAIDADGQHDPADAQKLIELHREDHGALIIGIRELESQPNVPGSSLFGCRFSNFWIKLETGKTLSDTQSGFRLYPLKSIASLKLATTRYDWEIEVLTRAIWSGIPIKEVPVSVTYTPEGGRVSHFDKFWDNLRISRQHTKLCTIRVLSTLLRVLTVFKMSGNEKIAGHEAGVSKKRRRESPGAAVLNFFVRNTSLYFVYFGAPIVVLFYFAFNVTARKAITNFYRQAFGYSTFKAVCHAYRNFLYFTAVLIDRLAMAQGRFAPLEVMEITSPILKPPPRSILVGAHFGDWLLSCAALGGKCDDKIGVVMDLTQNPKFQDFALNSNFRERLCVIDASRPRKEVILSITNVLTQNGHICFLADRGTKGNDCITVPFMGAPVQVPSAAFELATRLNSDAYCFFSTKSAYHPKAKYHVHIYQIADGKKKEKTEVVAANCLKILENHVRQSPQNWFNFFDFWQAENDGAEKNSKEYSDRLQSQSAH